MAALLPMVADAIKTMCNSVDNNDPETIADVLVEMAGGSEVLGPELDSMTAGALAKALIAQAGIDPALCYMLEGLVRGQCRGIESDDEPSIDNEAAVELQAVEPSIGKLAEVEVVQSSPIGPTTLEPTKPPKTAAKKDKKK